MKIDTDDYLTLAQACHAAGMSQSTGYRLAKRLEIVETFFGVQCVRKSHVQTMVNNRLPVGNNAWITDGEAASQDAMRSVESRMKRIRRSGTTAAERKRNKRLAEIGRTLGGRRKSKQVDSQVPSR